MNTPIELSATDAAAARTKFLDCMNHLPGTISILIVLGNDAASQKARDYVQFLLHDAPQDYASIQFVYAPAADHILSALKELPLKIKPDVTPFSWDDYDDYRVMSISPNHHYVSAFVAKDELNTTPSKIKKAILRALANGTH